MDRADQYLLRYQEALKQLRMHPGLVWSRNSFFLLVHTALLAVVTSSEAAGHSEVLAGAGVFLSLVWIWVNWAGQALQRRWRKLVVEFEADVFRSRDGEHAIQGPFASASESTGEGTWSVSITSALLVLSAGFLVVWSYFFVRAL